MGGINSDHIHGIATDPTTGNVLVTGGFLGTMDFGNGSVASGTGMTMFLAAYNSSGSNLWAKAWGGDAPGSGDMGYAVKIDGTGNLALTGQYNSWMDFNRDGLEDAGGSGYFVASFAVTGNSAPVYRWAKRSSTGNGVGYGVAFDSAGHVFSAGSFTGGLDPGGILATDPARGTAAFAAQYTK